VTSISYGFKLKIIINNKTSTTRCHLLCFINMEKENDGFLNPIYLSLKPATLKICSLNCVCKTYSAQKQSSNLDLSLRLIERM
jgi:hypothetical protein